MRAGKCKSRYHRLPTHACEHLLIYYKSEVTQNSKTWERNSFALYFLGVFFFAQYFELPPYLIKSAMRWLTRYSTDITNL
jgi:hypothetical protein